MKTTAPTIVKADKSAMQSSDSTAPQIDRRRRMAMLEATWEICALAMALPDNVQLLGESQEHFVVRGLAMRINDLSNAIMAGLGDDAVDTKSIERKVHGIDFGE